MANEGSAIAGGAGAGAASGTAIAPGLGTVIGAAFGAVGGAMQLGGLKSRSKAQARVRYHQKKEARRFGKEQAEISDSLRRAMEGVAAKHGMNLTEYLEARNGPLRIQAAQEAEARQVGAGQSGMDRALSVLAGPATMRAPESAALQASTATNEAIARPGLQAALDQIRNQGYLGGAGQFDVENQQELELANAPLENEVLSRQLLGGVRQAENSYFNQLMNHFLGKKMEQANQKGSGSMLLGSLFQLGGNALGSNIASQPSTTTAPPPAVNPNVLDAGTPYIQP